MASPFERFNHIPRRLREKLKSDFAASFVVTLGAGAAFFVLVAILTVVAP